jgi:hypothetical protein
VRAGSGAFARKFELAFSGADQNIVQMYAKNVLLPLAFLPMPSMPITSTVAIVVALRSIVIRSLP